MRAAAAVRSPSLLSLTSLGVLRVVAVLCVLSIVLSYSLLGGGGGGGGGGDRRHERGRSARVLRDVGDYDGDDGDSDDDDNNRNDWLSRARRDLELLSLLEQREARARDLAWEREKAEQRRRQRRRWHGGGGGSGVDDSGVDGDGDGINGDGDGGAGRRRTPYGVRPSSERMVGIAVVADRNFVRKMDFQIATQRAYCHVHDYDFWLLDPTALGDSTCQRATANKFFFSKHCVVVAHLQRMPVNYSLFVFDADIVMASTTSLARWTHSDHSADVVLYERSWNYELTAGAYMVRNTPFGRAFLLRWSELHALEPSGYSSSDNGALHLAVLASLYAVPRPEYLECLRLYRALQTNTVMDLTPYFRYVACTRRALGPPRRWRIDGPLAGSLTVMHRFHGMVMDGYLLYRRPGRGIPFYHGEKNATASNETFGWQFHPLSDDDDDDAVAAASRTGGGIVRCGNTVRSTRATCVCIRRTSSV